MDSSPWEVIQKAIDMLEAADRRKRRWPRRTDDFAPAQLLRDLEWVKKWTWLGEGGVWLEETEVDEREWPRSITGASPH